MDLFNENTILKLQKEEEKNSIFQAQGQHLKIVSASDPGTSFDYLLRIKQLFQKMLPKMPREYILRQVFDSKHCSLVLNDSSSQIVGAVCYRPVFERCFVEIVFFAIDSDYHISGYGTFLFSCFKEVCKMQYTKYLKVGDQYKEKDIEINDLQVFGMDEGGTIDAIDTAEKEAGVPCSPAGYLAVSGGGEKAENEAVGGDVREYTESVNLYMLTYADNSAIGFFKKQGFTLRPLSTSWKQYIKDYDGGTLMEGKIHKQINYLKKRELVEKIRDSIFQKMKEVNDYHIIRDGGDRAVLQEMHENSQERTREQFLFDFLFFLICDLQSNSSAWPFLEPVSIKIVPDYFDVIERPMDLSTIFKKHKATGYGSLKEFSDDIYLMINNCYTYNGSATQYYKCGENMQMAFENLLERYKDTIKRWEYDY